MLFRLECRGEWCFYLQADEVLHESDRARIIAAMRRYHHRRDIEGLSFRYHHFRADYSIRDPLPYRRQVRIVRAGTGVRSVGDACGFAINGRRLKVASTGGWVYHYGYVKPPARMSAKMDYFLSLYDGRSVLPGSESGRDAFEWDLSTCEPFMGTHPAVMRERIAAKNWTTPDVPLVSRWVNPRYWRGFLYKNTRTLRRWSHHVSFLTRPRIAS